MHATEFFKLGLSQGEVDFVDVRIDGDTRLFVDPSAIRRMPGTWAQECIALVQDFFQEVIDAIRSKDDARALGHLAGLTEPNETRLGMSRGRPRGRALGPDSSRDVWDALQRSEATQSGLLQHLEDTALLVRGIGPDIVSDITTNLIRGPLMAYTRESAAFHQIPLAKGVYSGRLWNPESHTWSDGGFTTLPIAATERLLLVPKAIVRRNLDYNTREYFHQYIIPYLEQREIAAGSSLVRLLKSRRTKKVNKKDLIAKYGANKETVIRTTLEETGLLDQYRRQKEASPSGPLDTLGLTEASGADDTNWDALIGELLRIPTGRDGETDYLKCIERLLSAIFSTSLAMPFREYKIHDGRKRIDISYANIGTADFFHWLGAHYPAPNVFVECKNYRGDPSNPELDQLSGRFAPSRGKFGLLCCRNFKNKALFIRRCHDTARDDRGFIIALDDSDIIHLAKLRSQSQTPDIYRFLKARFDELT